MGTGRTLVTGAAGVLGGAVVGLLEREPGVTLRLTDVLPCQTRHEFLPADLADRNQVAPLCEGVDTILHIAAIHPWKPYTREQYLRCNVDATYNLVQAAIAAGVRRIVYTSSVAAMGMARLDSSPLPWDEDKPRAFAPNDTYGFTKHVGEEVCRGFAAMGKFSYIALRPGMFIPAPESEAAFGLGLLSFTVHLSDVATAHLLAFRSSIENQAIIITSRTRFARGDDAALRSDARQAILRHYPQARRLADEGVKLPESIGCTYDIGRAERLLGYEPRHTFESWLARRYA